MKQGAEKQTSEQLQDSAVADVLAMLNGDQRVAHTDCLAAELRSVELQVLYLCKVNDWALERLQWGLAIDWLIEYQNMSTPQAEAYMAEPENWGWWRMCWYQRDTDDRNGVIAFIQKTDNPKDDGLVWMGYRQAHQEIFYRWSEGYQVLRLRFARKGRRR